MRVPILRQPGKESLEKAFSALEMRSWGTLRRDVARPMEAVPRSVEQQADGWPVASPKKPKELNPPGGGDLGGEGLSCGGLSGASCTGANVLGSFGALRNVSVYISYLHVYRHNIVR